MFSPALSRFARLFAVLCVLGAVVWIGGCPSTPPSGGGNGQPTDTDGDGVNDDVDQCADTPAGAAVDAMGCPVEPGETDTDGDGVPNDADLCPDTPVNAVVDDNGCPDSDGDGVADNVDQCADTEAGVTVDQTGCEEGGPGPGENDADGDGVTDENDDCPDTPAGENVDADGCPITTPVLDSDGDGVNNDADDCPNTAASVMVDAAGCPISQGGPDSDRDGVNDDIDQCADSPPGASVNFNGCPDSDGDGVFDEADECSATASGAVVDENGCAASQRDTDGDGVNDNIDECPGTSPRETVDAVGCPIGNGGGDPVCGNGTVETGEACDDGNTTGGDGCSAACQLEPGVCGDGTLNTGEECDDGNTTAGDGCDANCELEPGVCGDGTLNSGEGCDDGNTTPGDGCDENCQTEVEAGNDTCTNPTTATDGTISFSTAEATTDAIAGGGLCVDTVDMLNDVWFCYAATCSGTATVSLCGSGYDSTVYVYSDCICPQTAPLVCNDDGCGSGVDARSSRTTFPAAQGQSYLIRIGGFEGDTGAGSLTVFCGTNSGRGPSACGTNANNCEGANNSPACSDQACCANVCSDVDPYCCDVEWDSVCAEEGIGICGDGFTACGSGAGDCFTEHLDESPGCANEGICQTVCESDPFCCLDIWDDICAESATLLLADLAVCQTATGSCTQEHVEPGCSNESCCELVCLEDSFCCTNEWDQSCIDIATANQAVCR